MTPRTRRTTRITATLVALALVLSVLGPVGTVAAQPSVSIQVSPETTTVAPGEELTLNIDWAGEEVNAPAIEVLLPDGATVVDHTDDGGTFTTLDPNSDAAWVFLGGTSHQVTLTITAPTTPGEAVVTVIGSAIDPATNQRLVQTTDATVTVEAAGPGPIGNFQNPPTDTDGDGVYEDTNGDGTFDIVDVQATFANREDPVIQNNPDLFDFNGDGTFDIVDVQAQFVELVG